MITARDQKALMTEILDPQISENLENFVMFIYPWGQENTPLHDKKGPRSWQRDELQRITEHIKKNKSLIGEGKTPIIYKSATSSGRGSGKSAFSSWLAHWMMSTQLGSTTIISANNEEQLRTRTGPELGAWLTLSINESWFDKTAEYVRPAAWLQTALKNQLKIDSQYYYIHFQLWNEETPEGFAGAHNPKGLMVLFDEASGIPKPIWDVTDGFYTEKSLHRYQFAFSNPRRNTGAFFECFHKNREFWHTRYIDCRTIEDNDKQIYEAIIKQNGEDSDEARVEVYGQFPKQGDRQFISRQIVEEAANRDLIMDPWAPLIMGVDPARFGDDKTVIRFRRGRDARTIPPFKLKGADNMLVANTVAKLSQDYKVDMICVDAGNGTGIIDRLREMNYKVHEVWFGSKSDAPEYANKRTELWAKMREWLNGACIDKDEFLLTDLVSPEYKFMGTSDRQMLETKEQMKQKGFASPDDADALCCTFAVNVARHDTKSYKNSNRTRQAKDMDYSIFG
ncbi:MAG TPA: terminase family protein [Nitrosomonas sp.]|nr:terminase family protein [Nitrosomonas sp.]